MKVRLFGKPVTFQTKSPGPDYWGMAYDFNSRSRIEISPEVTGQLRLEIINHEVLHLGNWRLSERLVETIAEAQAKAAWLAGFREIPELSRF